MTIVASYIPDPSQTDAQAAARAAALGIGLAPREIPPVYARAATVTPGIVAECGTVAYRHDDGTLTTADVTALLAPLNAQQAVDQTTAANLQTILARAANALAANGTFLALAPPTNAQTIAQVQLLTRQVNALIRLTLNTLSDITGT